MAGHHTQAYLLPTPLLPPSAAPRSVQSQTGNLNNSIIRPLLSPQTPKPLINTYTPSTSTQSLTPHNIPPLLPSPTKIPALMQQASTSIDANFSQTNRYSQSPVTSVSTNQVIGTHPVVTSEIKPLIPPRPKPLMSQSSGNYPHNKPGCMPTGVPLMSQFPAQAHPGHYPPPLMQQPLYPQQFAPYPSAQAYIPPHKRHRFRHGAPLMGHQPPYPSQQWHRGRGRGRGRHSRGRGSGVWKRDNPQSNAEAYCDEYMFEDPWKELMNKAGVVECKKPAVNSNSSDQGTRNDSDTARPDQNEASIESCKDDSEVQVELIQSTPEQIG